MEPRISFITLGVSQLKRAKKFYEKGLGWKASSASQGDVVFFQLGGIAFSLFPRKNLAHDAQVSPSGSGFRGFTLAYNVRKKSDVDSLLLVAKKAGGKIVKKGQPAFWGGYSGYFSDPDGYLWEVAWNPFIKINKKGEVTLL